MSTSQLVLRQRVKRFAGEKARVCHARDVYASALFAAMRLPSSPIALRALPSTLLTLRSAAANATSRCRVHDGYARHDAIACALRNPATPCRHAAAVLPATSFTCKRRDAVAAAVCRAAASRRVRVGAAHQRGKGHVRCCEGDGSKRARHAATVLCLSAADVSQPNVAAAIKCGKMPQPLPRAQQPCCRQGYSTLFSLLIARC